MRGKFCQIQDGDRSLSFFCFYLTFNAMDVFLTNAQAKFNRKDSKEVRFFPKKFAFSASFWVKF